MKKLIFLLLVFVLCETVKATEQMPDYLYYQGKKMELATGWGHPSPLETYFYQNKIKYPFEMLHTANYRGHVATWEIENDKLFLKELDINDTLQKPQKYGIKSKTDTVVGTGVFADWFSGVISCEADKKAYYFYVRYGEVIDMQILLEEDFKRIRKISESETDTIDNDLMDKYRILVLNQNYISYYFRLIKEDSITIDNKGGFFEGKSGFSPLLEYYSDDHMKWPYNWENFEKNGAPNCKWIVENNNLYLTEIKLYSGTGFYEIDIDSVSLSDIFENKVTENKVFADWVSGIYIVKYGDEKADDLFPAYKEFTLKELSYLRIIGGVITEKYTVPADFNFRDIPADTDPGLKKIITEYREQ